MDLPAKFTMQTVSSQSIVHWTMSSQSSLLSISDFADSDFFHWKPMDGNLERALSDEPKADYNLPMQCKNTNR